MPAIRSSKGNTPNGNDKGKGKAPNPVSPTTQRKNNVGRPRTFYPVCILKRVVVNRKGELIHVKSAGLLLAEKVTLRVMPKHTL